MLERSSIVNSLATAYINQWLNEDKSRELALWRNIKKKPGGGDMTICVATLNHGGAFIVGASDRRLTAQDLSSDPMQTKLWSISPAIVAMVSGDDISFPIAVLQDLQDILNKKTKKNKNIAFSVRDVAHSYCELFRAHRNQAIEEHVLSRIGLTFKSFITQQSKINRNIADELWGKIKGYPVPKTEVIFAGIDGQPAVGHLYLAENDVLTCQDAAGYTAIGEGAYHAQAHLMLMNHSRNVPLHIGLYATYSAKKRAEIIKTIGAYTDMFCITAKSTPPYKPLSPDEMAWIDGIYMENMKHHQVGFLDAISKMQAGPAGSTSSAPSPPSSQSPGGEKKTD